MDFKDILEINTGAGAEKTLLDKINSKFYDAYFDNMGSLHAKKKNAKITFYTAADAEAFVVTYVRDSGEVVCHNMGKIEIAEDKTLKITNGEIFGEISKKDGKYIAKFDLPSEEIKKKIKLSDVLFPITTANTKTAYGLGAPYKACVYSVLKAAGNAENANFVFLTQSVLGARSSSQASFSENSEYAVFVRPYEGEKIAVNLAGKQFSSDVRTVDIIEKAAKDCGMKISKLVKNEELTDAFRIQSAGVSSKTAEILLPFQNTDKKKFSVKKSDADALSSLIVSIINCIQN